VSLDKLNEARKKLKKGKDLSEYSVLEPQGYFEELTAKEARTFFKIRAEVFDLKCFRTYKYEDSICRLCEDGEEDLNHVVNECTEIPRFRLDPINTSTEDIDDIRDIIRRMDYFYDVVDT
jgi:hypothetical protein